MPADLPRPTAFPHALAWEQVSSVLGLRTPTAYKILSGQYSSSSRPQVFVQGFQHQIQFPTKVTVQAF